MIDSAGHQEADVRPEISVVMPNFNKSKYIGFAIESVLSQTLQSFELIIVDDASTDSSMDVAKIYQDHDHRIRIIRNAQNRGVSATRNVGILASRAPIITFMDSDDLFSPNRLETQLNAIRSEKDLVVAYSEPIFVDESVTFLPASKMKKKNDRPNGWIIGNLLTKEFMIGCLYTLPKVCFEKIGLYDESIRNGQNFEVQLRLAKYFRFVYVPVLSYGYRTGHFAGYGREQKRAYYKSLSRVIEMHLIGNLSRLDSKTTERAFRKLFAFCYFSRQWKMIAKYSFKKRETLKALAKLPYDARKYRVA